MIIEMLLKSGLPAILKTLPEGVRDFLDKTGITEQERLKRITNKQFTEHDIAVVSTNTLDMAQPYLNKALDFLSAESNADMCICIRKSKEEIGALTVSIAYDSSISSEADFKFVDTVTNVLAIIKLANEGANSSTNIDEITPENDNNISISR